MAKSPSKSDMMRDIREDVKRGAEKGMSPRKYEGTAADRKHDAGKGMSRGGSARKSSKGC